jgi:serine/threonine protein kinase
LPEKYYAGSITSANSNFSPVFSDGMLSPTNHHSSHSLTLDDFEFIKVIGKGGFSKVFQGKSRTLPMFSSEERHRQNLRHEDSEQSQDQERQQSREHQE